MSKVDATVDCNTAKAGLIPGVHPMLWSGALIGLLVHKTTFNVTPRTMEWYSLTMVTVPLDPEQAYKNVQCVWDHQK